MKIAMLFLAALLPFMAQARNNTPQDTLVVNKPTKVTVITSDSLQTIYIQGKEGNPKYAYCNSIQLVDSNYVSTSTIDNDFNFSIGPFGRKQTKSQKYPTTETTMNFFAGFNAAPGMPQAADLHPFSSWELWWLIADCGIYPWNSHHKFSIGFGLDWRNYRIKGDTRFVAWDVINEAISDGGGRRGINGVFGGSWTENDVTYYDQEPEETDSTGLKLNWTSGTGNQHFYWG